MFSLPERYSTDIEKYSQFSQANEFGFEERMQSQIDVFQRNKPKSELFSHLFAEKKFANRHDYPRYSWEKLPHREISSFIGIPRGIFCLKKLQYGQPRIDRLYMQYSVPVF